jgi:cellulose synthase/poly-beta-1,6-N-acetylglucosamine synthase-like glycosyltransferase
MIWAECCFWLCFACVAYTYIGYPLLIAVLARIKKKHGPRSHFTGSISFVVAAYNEAAFLERRLRELTDLLRASGLSGEVILISDGSSDGTAAVAREHAQGPVRVLEMPVNCGKATALSLGCAMAQHEIIVFADARQSWEPQALTLLLENFADPSVGAVSGDLVLEKAPGVLAGVGLYWRYEKWLRRNESVLYSTTGVTGAISAVRRQLFRPIPQGTILDDVYWPLQVVMQGFRVVHDTRARACDVLPAKVGGEFQRKLRTLSGNYQLLARLPAALLPWRNPIWFQFFSHKALRLVVPWALLGMGALSMWMEGHVYRAALAVQVCACGLALTGLWRRAAARSRIVSAAGSFFVLNAAAWLAFWVWLTGWASRSWHKVVYQEPVRLAMDIPTLLHRGDGQAPEAGPFAPTPSERPA